MSISRTAEEALQSVLRMTGMSRFGLEPHVVPCSDDALKNPTYQRVLAVASALAEGKMTLDAIHSLSGIDRWFLSKMHRIINHQQQELGKPLTEDSLRESKRLGFSDAAIAHWNGTTELGKSF